MTPILPVGKLTATIANAASLSNAVNLEGWALCGVITPSGWTTAAISFQASYDGTNFFVLWNGAAEASYAAVPASRWVTFDPAIFYAIPYIKIQSGTSAATVNQAGGDDVILITRKL